jgi:type VII secretion integral membrane protein EccD
MTVSNLEPAEAVGYSRVTLIGRRKRADLVLPSTESIGALLPEMLVVLDERADGVPHRLAVATSTGDLLSADVTLDEAGVPDGAVLRLVAEDEVPPPPIVNDVTEETASDLERRAGRMTRLSRQVITVALVGLTSALLSVEIVAGNSARDAFWILAVVAVGCWLAAVLAGIGGLRWVGGALAVAGALSAAGVAYVGTSAHSWMLADRIAVVVCAGWVGAGLTGALWRRRGPLLGAVVGLALTIGWAALRRSPLHAVEADALVATACVVVLGLLPRWALTVSGLASLDDRRLAGEQVSRRALVSSLLAAHTGLIWATVAASLDFAIAASSLAHSAEPWPLGLAGAAALVVLLRSRSFPLTAEVVAITAAAAGAAITLQLDWLDGGRRLFWPVVTTVALGVALAGSLLLNPAAHVQARLRGLADRLEAAAVLALIPLVIGVFGVYGRLLHAF